MPETDRSILVDAPLESVFEYVADYRNATRYQKHFSRFEPAGEPTRGLGLTVDARGWFKGLPIRARLRIVEFVENERILSKSVAHLKSSAEWRFAREGELTRVRFIASYDWPVPILSRGLRKSLQAEIDALTESALQELKQQVEALPPTPPASG